MALEPRTVQCMPARLSRVAMATLHPASTTRWKCTSLGRGTLGSACGVDWSENSGDSGELPRSAIPGAEWRLAKLVRIRFEEQENHHPGDRNIEPNGERPACDSAVHREPPGQREKERCQHHGQRDDGENYVAG